MLLPSTTTLRRSSTSDDVAALLRNTIVAGQLAPGTQLREVALAAELGVSRPTLREALRSLERDGLVMHRANRGVFVASLGAEDVEDLYRVRVVLEASAARACAEATDDALAALRAAFEEVHGSWGGDDLGRLVDTDLRFHAAIVALLGSPRLDATFAAACDGLRLCLSAIGASTPHVARGPAALEQHRAILAALTARDAERAERLVLRHIEVNRSRIARLFAGA